MITPEIQFQIDWVSKTLVTMLMERYDWDMKRAVDDLIPPKPSKGLQILNVAYIMKVLSMSSPSSNPKSKPANSLNLQYIKDYEKTVTWYNLF